MVAALQRPGGRDHGARCRHLARERADAPGRHAGNPLGPFGRPALQRGLEGGRARAAALQERPVGQPLRQQHLAERQHHRGIGAGADRDPLAFDIGRQVVAERRDGDEARTAPGRLAYVARGRVLPVAAGIDLRVLHRQAAEGHHQPRMPDDGGPVGYRAPRRLDAAQDMWQDRQPCRIAVIVELVGEAARHAEKALQLALGMVEAPGARPAVGAAEDRGIAEVAPDAGDLLRDQIDRPVPVERHEGVAAPAFAAVAVEPAAPRRRPVDARAMMHGVRDRGHDGRRLGVLGERQRARDAPACGLGPEGAPVRAVVEDRHRVQSPRTCLATMLRWISFDPP